MSGGSLTLGRFLCICAIKIGSEGGWTIEYSHVSFDKVQEDPHLASVLVCLNLYNELGNSLQ